MPAKGCGGGVKQSSLVQEGPMKGKAKLTLAPIPYTRPISALGSLLEEGKTENSLLYQGQC